MVLASTSTSPVFMTKDCALSNENAVVTNVDCRIESELQDGQPVLSNGKNTIRLWYGQSILVWLAPIRMAHFALLQIIIRVRPSRMEMYVYEGLRCNRHGEPASF